MKTILAILILLSLEGFGQDSSRYIKITASDSAKWQGVKKGVNVYNCVKTIHGYYVVDDNTLEDFPEAFINPVFVWLTINDFPKPKEPF